MSRKDPDAKSELPLIMFTTCTPAAVGVTAVGLVFGAAPVLACVALGLTVVGMVASVAHLARPLRAPRSLRHLSTSWLSREIVAVSLFACILAVWTAMGLSDFFGFLDFSDLFADQMLLQLGLDVLALAIGCILIAIIAKAYTVHSQPAWDGPDTLREVVAVACSFGGAAALCTVIALVGLPALGVTMQIEPLLLLISPIACVVAAMLTVAGAWFQRSAARIRLRRVAEVAADDVRPRAAIALEKLESGKRQQRVLNGLFICAALLGVAAAVLAFLAWSEQLDQSRILHIAALSCAALCALMSFIGCVRMRNRFYHLADTGRFAVRLHGW